MSQETIYVKPSGSGKSIVLDNISTVYYPIYKVAFGDFGSATNVDATNPFPIGLYGYHESWQKVGMDPLSSCLLTMDFEHHHVHEGATYEAWFSAAGVANNATAAMLMTTKDTDDLVHIVCRATVTAQCLLEIIEAPTATHGNAITPRNRNRSLANPDASTDTVSSTPTSISGGTVIYAELLGSGRASGGESRSSAEYILKRNTKYLFRVTCQAGSGGTSNINIDLGWYSHGASI